MSSFRQRVKQMFIFSILAFAANFDYGFSTTYLNTPVDQFKAYLNESLHRWGHTMDTPTYNWMWNLILNIWFVGFFIGIWFSPLLNDKYGRKVGYIIGNIVALAGAIMRFLAMVFYQPELLFVGRFITSIALAVTYQSCILYLQECSPTELRGFMSFLSEISFAIMCLVGTILGTSQVLGNHLEWLLGFAVPFCAFFLLVLFFIPETPKFLLLVKKDREAACKSVIYYHGEHVDPNEVLKEISMEAEGETEVASSMTAVKEILTESHLRKALFLSCAALQNTVALWSLLLSSTYFLTNVNVESSIAAWSSSAMTLAYVIGTLTGSALIERVGRRGLLLTFTCLNNFFLITFVICSQLQPVADGFKYGAAASCVMYAFTYGAGVGPISWFISSELVPQKYRSLTQSLCYAINTLMVVATTFSILPLYNSIGAYAFLILYSGPSILCIVYLFFNLPETKGKEIHQVVAHLKGKYDSVTEF